VIPIAIGKAFFEGIAALSLKKITQYSAKRSYAKSGSYFLIITKLPVNKLHEIAASTQLTPVIQSGDNVLKTLQTMRSFNQLSKFFLESLSVS